MQQQEGYVHLRIVVLEHNTQVNHQPSLEDPSLATLLGCSTMHL